jgi:hypothetical protein
LYYYRARYYDAHIGRFISEDPSGIDGGINLYLYVHNNPVNYVDPTGLKYIPQCGCFVICKILVVNLRLYLCVECTVCKDCGKTYVDCNFKGSYYIYDDNPKFTYLFDCDDFPPKNYI